jgi:hypothetical protein
MRDPFLRGRGQRALPASLSNSVGGALLVHPHLEARDARARQKRKLLAGPSRGSGGVPDGVVTLASRRKTFIFELQAVA